MPRLLSILGLVAFVAGAVALAVAAYILIAGVIGWNPFSQGRPMIAGVRSMGVMALLGVALLILGAVLAQVSARAEARRDNRATLAA